MSYQTLGVSFFLRRQLLIPSNFGVKNYFLITLAISVLFAGILGPLTSVSVPFYQCFPKVYPAHKVLYTPAENSCRALIC